MSERVGRDPNRRLTMDNGACSYRRFLDGDETAFDDIMNELFHSLMYFINRYVHDFHAAEDIAMDTFADLLVHKNRYNFKVTLKTYLFMMGRSRALDYLKRKRTIPFVELNEEIAVESDEKTLEEIVITDERKRIVNGAIAKLNEEMQIAIHLFYFENMTYAEIARVMKKNEKQVDNLLYRAKKELRAILDKDGELL